MTSGVGPRSHVRAAGPRVCLHASKDVLPDSPLGCAEAGDLDAAGSDVLVQDGRNLLVELTLSRKAWIPRERGVLAEAVDAFALHGVDCHLKRIKARNGWRRGRWRQAPHTLLAEQKSSIGHTGACGASLHGVESRIQITADRVALWGILSLAVAPTLKSHLAPKLAHPLTSPPLAHPHITASWSALHLLQSVAAAPARTGT